LIVTDVNEFRVLVCGGRNYDDRERLYKALNTALRSATSAGKVFILIHGNARGADTLSDDWAKERQVAITTRVYPADWAKHNKAAGPIRNRLMLTTENPHVIIACSGGSGTADMIRIGKKAGVPVLEIE
jgi:hypothetical protein